MFLFILNSDELPCCSHTSASCRLALEEDAENQYEMSGRRSGHRPPQLAGAGAGWLWNKGRCALKKAHLLDQSGKGIYFFLIRLTGWCLAMHSWAGLRSGAGLMMKPHFQTTSSWVSLGTVLWTLILGCVASGLEGGADPGGSWVCVLTDFLLLCA